MNTAVKEDAGKLRNALIVIVVSALGILIDFIMRRPIVDCFSIGFILCFVSFLFSFSSVRERGSNLLPQLAFWISFIGMWTTILLSVG